MVGHDLSPDGGEPGGGTRRADRPNAIAKANGHADRVEHGWPEETHTGQRSSTAEDAARLLAEWYSELGYLEHADAVQIVSYEYGDRFLCLTAHGKREIRGEVIDALWVLMLETDSLRHFPFWERWFAARPPADLS